MSSIDNVSPSKSNDLLFGKYEIENKIGEGSFGKIYIALNVQTNERFALKIENKRCNNLLEEESHILLYLKGEEGIPQILSYGYSGQSNVLVMELLGPSLNSLLEKNNGSFSLKTVCLLGEQILRRIEYIHSRHLIHRDIKPDNMTMGIEENANIVYIIDFGLSKKYRSSKTLEHIKFKTNKRLTGNARFASINALKGCEQSRRDDLESICYLLIFFLKGTLPWQGIKGANKEKCYKKIYQRKLTTTPECLCYKLPSELKEFVKYTRQLRFDEEPNYDYLRGLLRSIMISNEWSYDFLFDWTEQKKKTKYEETNTETIITDTGTVYETIADKKEKPSRNVNEELNCNANTRMFDSKREMDTNRNMNKNLMRYVEDNNYKLISNLKKLYPMVTKQRDDFNVKLSFKKIKNDTIKEYTNHRASNSQACIIF